MLKSMQRGFNILVIALIISMSFFNVPVYAQTNTDALSSEQQTDEVSLRTNLEDNLVTKADKLTFDLWAYDKNDKKIDTGHIKVTNNDKSVAINWDDSEKTSYTLELEEGKNTVIITVKDKYTLEYNITREPAEDGDVIGTYTFTLEGFTIGLGYFIEPVQLDIIKGQNASEALLDALDEYGYEYSHWSPPSFYLEYIMDGTNKIFKTEPKIPDVIIDAAGGEQHFQNGYYPDSLGEFDFSSGSGWMYAVNNVFPNVGFYDFYLSDGDVMRVQFTLMLGSDLGGGMGADLFDISNKDMLTQKIAEINSSEEKDNYLAVDLQKEAYDQAIDTLQKVNANQIETDKALEKIIKAEKETVDKDVAQKVVDEIDNLPKEADLKLSDKDAVKQARTAFEKLTESQQKLVSNLEKLESAESKIAALEKEATDKKVAQKVIDEINNLPKDADLKLSDKDAVERVRIAFEKLTESQQKLVSNLEQLESAESKIAALEKEATDKEAAQKVVKEIDNLPKEADLKLSNKDAVKQARTAFEKLTESQQKLVSNLEKLESAESKIAALEKEATDKKVAQKVIDEINNLPKDADLKLSDKDAVERVRIAFEKLTESQQKLVSNLEQLESAESKIAALEKQAADKDVAQKVVDEIDNLPKEADLKLSDKDAIEKARTAFEKLTESQQKFVSNLEKLKSAESKIAALEKEATDKKVAQKVIDEINNLPKEADLKLSDKEAVEKARTAFEKLTESQQKFVSNLDKLESAESKIAELEKETTEKEIAQKVIDEINNLPKEADLKLSDKEAVEQARTAFEKLTETQQKLVSNIKQLESAESKIAALEKEATEKEMAQKIVDEINNLPKEADLKLSDKEAVEKARTAFEKLIESQQKFVSNIEQLESAESKIAALEKEAADKKFVQKVVDEIDNLPKEAELKLSDKEAVEQARTSFEKLTKSQRKFVSNLEQLESAESKIAALEKEAADNKVAQKVVDEINNLPKEADLKLSDKEAVEKVRTAYKDLRESQQKFVSNLEKLELIESKLNELEKEARDKEVAEKLEVQIEKLPKLEDLSLSDKDLVGKARVAFDNLTESQRKLVKNIAVLESVESKLEVLKKEAANNKEAQKVDKLINEIPKLAKLKLSDKDLITRARKAYSELSEAQHKLVSNLKKLELAEDKLVELENDKQTAQKVEEKINLLPEISELKLSDENMIEKANTAYENLTRSQKKLVTNLEKLELAKVKIKELLEDKKAAEEIEKLINSLPELSQISLEHLQKIEETRRAYNKLSKSQRKFVSNFDNLEKKQMRISELELEETFNKESGTIEEYKGKSTELVLPEKINGTEVKEIKSGAFKDKNIKSIKIPKTIKTIKEETFSDNEIESIVIPETVTEIGRKAFSNNKLKTVEIAEDNLLPVNEKARVTFAGNKITDIPEKKEYGFTIGEEAFANNDLEYIYIPEKVINIEKGAFKGNKIGEGNAEINNFAKNVTVKEKAFSYNGVNKNTEITPIYLKDEEENEKLARAVVDMINDLPNETELKVSDRDAVEEARKALKALTESQQKYVSNIERLLSVESKLDELEKEAIEKEAAKNIEEMIGKLPDVDKLKISDKDAVEEARKAFKALTKSQQKLVSNLEKLELAESKLADLEKEATDKEAAKNVEEMINDLPKESDLKLSDKESIEAARTAFDNLTESQQKLISNITKLEANEAKLDELEKEATDQAKAQEVKDKINALPSIDKLLIDDKQIVEDVRSNFNNLTESQKEYVLNIAKLESVENKLAQLEEEAINNKEAAQKVVNQISNLPEKDELKVEDKNILDEIVKSFMNLKDEAKELVTNKGKLDELQTKMAELEQLSEDQALANKVALKIDSLPTESEISLDYKQSVKNVRAEYNDLTEEQKSLLSNIDKLEALEAKIQDLEAKLEQDQVKANEVIEVINSLPSEADLTLEDKEKVKNARDSYEILKDDQKLLLSNIDKLETLEEVIQELENKVEQDYTKANEIVKMIDNLPSLMELTLEDREKVEKARANYNALTSEQKLLVSNLKQLDELELKLVELDELEPELSVDKTKLQLAIDQGKKADIENKTEESIMELQSAIDNAEKVLKTKNTSQKEVDQAIKFIEIALDNLQSKKEQSNKVQAKENEQTEKNEVEQESDENEMPKQHKNEKSELSKSTKDRASNLNAGQDEANKDNQTNKLPGTATNVFNLLLTGFLMVSIASFILFYLRRKSVKE